MSELTRDSALEFLADYITNNKINYVGGEFEREDNNERFLIVVSKESALKNLTEENQRLTAIATKHAMRADDLYDCANEIKSLLVGVLDNEYIPNWQEIESKLGAQVKIIDKSRIEAEQDDA
ncbi:hypothetical protein [Shewanella chilikensis]|uniref:hypothetical protein n=1 Tax=Shewanella chilikensis TaxID=558541 RepID=UPI003A986F9D